MLKKKTGKKTLASSLKAAGAKKPETPRKDLLWKGPEVDGVTQSMLSAFIVCRERFRLKYVLGLRTPDEFNPRMEYGKMWHLCEETLAKDHGHGAVTMALQTYCKKLCKRFPLQQEQVQKWYNVCLVQFPIYIDYWMKQKSRKKTKSLLQEFVFSVPYELPSGRTVKLRGMMDEVSLEGTGRNAAIYLDENKTKSVIDDAQMQRQLSFDLQTMLYLIALQDCQLGQIVSDKIFDSVNGVLPKVAGVNYNVVRRPLSGGKGSIRPHKATSKKRAETMPDFYARLGVIIAEEPESYFMRWQVQITKEDIETYKRTFLDPILESLCAWYEWISSVKDPFSCTSPRGFALEGDRNSFHYRTPFGIYNILAEGGSTEYDEYMDTGSMAGLEQTDYLFEELRK